MDAQSDFDSGARYHRQEILPVFGRDAQERLRGSHALIVGCGALGCAAIDLLARAGVGTLTLVDRDVVELTNLQRQSLFTEADVRQARPKAEAAKRRVAEVNRQVRVYACVEHMGAEQAPEFVRDCDVVIDGLDNYHTRYILNDCAVQLGKPYMHAGVVGTRGTSMPVLAGIAACVGIAAPDAPCLRCIFPDAPPPGEGQTCDTAGVFGPAVAAIGARAAGEAIKALAGCFDAIDRTLVELDAWTGRSVRIALSGARRADCPCCGLGDFAFLRPAADSQCTVLCGRNAVQVRPAALGSLDLARMGTRLAPHGTFALREGTLVGEIAGGMQLTLFADGRAILRGTVDPAVAQAIYDRLIGT